MASEKCRTTDIGDVFGLIVRDMAERLVAEVMPAVRREIAGFVAENAQLAWSEEAAAKELDMSEQKLAALAKAGKISFSYAIEPTVWDKRSGRAQNGRRVYMRHHLINYLLAREVRAVTSTPQDMTAGSVYRFDRKEAA